MSIMVLLWLLPNVAAMGLLLLAASGIRFWRVSAEVAAGLLIASFGFILATPFTFVTKIALGVLQVWALLLCARLLFGRLVPAFVQPSTRLNVCCLLAAMAGVTGLWWLGNAFPGLLGGYEWRLEVLITVVTIALLIGIVQFIWATRHFKLVADEAHRALRDLPTVSVCIPARNEDHALADCLAMVIASDYPKLEVIVLDDCSQDKTSQIIRGFAHDGVRFIQGDTPATGWLGKNQAMQTLAEHATGDFILFMDVDTLLSPQSISQLVDYALDNQMSMLSVLPHNRLGLQPAALFGTLRYMWQMALPIRKRRVPVASQAWLIDADQLQALGGFKSVAQKVVPEGSFARRLFTADKYRFIAGNASLGITTAKRWQSQVSSAVRLLYPTYKRQPVFALGAIVAILALFVLPPLVIAWAWWAGDFGRLFVFAAVAHALGLIMYALVMRRTHPRIWLLAAILLPYVAMQEVLLIIASLAQYEFGEVNWKGRNVCYPVISLPQNRRRPQA